jgi:glycosyltransferase involved in cell wall biosynthesis
MKPILTIGITSYKRVNELVRCINSIETKYIDDIEILVSEDKSPLSAEIQTTVESLAKSSPYNIRFTTNEVNLGYDMNLGAIIKKSQGEYIFFMSDDDAVADGCLDEVIEFIKTESGCGVLYSPFLHTQNGKLDRVRGENHFIPAGEDNAAKYIYDSILFSGLIFKKDYVERYDSSRFKNHNYFQVYLFLQMMLHHGGYYFKKASVLCIGDGENAYGISESSGGNAILANRKSVKSNLEFNKTLIKVIRMFDEDEGTHVMDSFAKQYSLHSYAGLSRARDEGTTYFKEYWEILKGLDIKRYPITNVYYALLLVLGRKKTDILLSGAKRLVKREK